MLQIGNDWRDLLRFAWSVRLLAVAFAFTAVEAGVQMVMYKAPLSENWQAIITGLLVGAAFVSRFVVQKRLG